MSTEQQTTFITGLRRWMDRERLTADQACDRLDISLWKLRCWLSGTHLPSAYQLTQVLERIAKS